MNSDLTQMGMKKAVKNKLCWKQDFFHYFENAMYLLTGPVTGKPPIPSATRRIMYDWIWVEEN